MLQKFDERNANLKININGTLYARDDAGISPFASVVQGGDGVWEGLRVYDGCIFKLTEHLDRLRLGVGHGIGEDDILQPQVGYLFFVRRPATTASVQHNDNFVSTTIR